MREHGHPQIADDYAAYRRAQEAKRFEHDRLTVQKRDGRVVSFKPEKIAIAIGKAVAAGLSAAPPTAGPGGAPAGQPSQALSAEQQQRILELADDVVEALKRAAPGIQTIHIETIQDEVERMLAARGSGEVAQRYAAYRQEHHRLRRQPTAPRAPITASERLTIRHADGATERLDLEHLTLSIAQLCRGLEDRVLVSHVLEAAVATCFDGMKASQLDDAVLLAIKALIEQEPAYSFVAARWLLRRGYRELLGRPVSFDEMRALYPAMLARSVAHLVEHARLRPALLGFDLERLGAAIRPERDLQFGYMGLQTLYDRYFLHTDGRRWETPQLFWMRVAMGLALGEGDQKHERAIEFYEAMSTFRFIPSTPTLFNAGTPHPQLSSCFLTTVHDDLEHIFKSIKDNAMLSKWSGGLGNDWTPVRALGAHIKGTNGKSQGIIPFMKVANDTAVAVNQCFAPETTVFTADGVKSIKDVQIRDLVLGRYGRYREVTNHLAYRQQGRMVEVQVKHALYPLKVSSGHPFLAIQGVPMDTSIERTMQRLTSGKVAPGWVEAGQLRQGDYVAQVVPTEVVAVAGFTAEDARLYGIVLGDGHLTKHDREWGVAGEPTGEPHMQFVRDYLSKRGIHFWETRRNARYGQIRWASGYSVGRDTSTGRLVRAGVSPLSFGRADLYDEHGRKHIARRFAHLPPPQTLALIQGLLETDGGVSRGQEIYFTNTSAPLVEGLRYQLLRLGVPCAGQYRIRDQAHIGRRVTGERIEFKGITRGYDLRIPAVPEVARLVGCRPITKHNWLVWKGWLFTRVRSVRELDPVPLVYDLKVEGDESYMTSAVLAHNGGKRQGAVCAYLEVWHLDIEEFLELRKNTGDERRRTHDMHTANWIPDLFMKRVLANGTWTLFSPDETPDLHDRCGRAFEQRYEAYEAAAQAGRIRRFRTVSAVELWRKMLSMLFETGHPWITFKDPSNLRSPQDHCGVVHSSNLCTEILLNTSRDETAVCNLGSVNLAAHTSPAGLDGDGLAQTVTTAIRMLDNVIDANYYPTREAEMANLRHRPVGLGLMGFQDALYAQGLSYASPQAIEFADESTELIAYHAILASSRLAEERGAYMTYRGSKWDRGLLPLDTVAWLAAQRGGHVTMDRSFRLDWQPVRESIRRCGMRNSNVMAIAPTATIANVIGVTQSIEPAYKNLYVKSNLSGEFTIINPWLVEELKALGLWDGQMIQDLKYFDGGVQEIARVPAQLRARYATAFELGYEWLIEAASRRQKWIDMGQSLNLYMVEPSGKKLHAMYLMAWEKGLKTTYYLRTLGATRIEKSTLDVNKYGNPLGQKWRAEAPPAACQVNDKGECEACQ
ncbi:MAG: ribonucleoside-diphosphate reductase subunit alpha [Candidatus Omnitrophica bacterium]|nr:ribonucleoside-diphosphate reductase subunit alpha [Candidatus Omnitrophota bacterium]